MGSKRVYRARRSCATTIVSIVVAVQFVGGCGAKSGVAMAQAQAQSSKLPNVILEAEPRYLLGFPMLVAVTYDNSGSATQFLRLPELTYWTASGAFRLNFEPVGTGGLPLATKATPLEMDEKGMVLNPGEVLRLPLDLSNFATGLRPGTYKLTFTLVDGPHSRSSQPVQVVVEAPSAADVAVAEKFRRMAATPTDTGGWGPFLTKNWNTVPPVSGLSAGAQRQLRLHLFLHRAFYGPEGAEKLDYSPLKVLDGPVLEPEAQLLMLEGLAAAKGAAGAQKQGSALAAKWPGLRRRVEEVLAGRGVIAVGRSTFGAEAKRLRPPATQPYK
jgi:hypothetical protein